MKNKAAQALRRLALPKNMKRGDKAYYSALGKLSGEARRRANLLRK